MYYGEHGLVGFAGEEGKGVCTTFKASREVQRVVAGEGGGLAVFQRGRGLCHLYKGMY